MSSPKIPSESEQPFATPSGNNGGQLGEGAQPSILFPGHDVVVAHKKLRQERIKGWGVQFELPVNNPVNNVRRTMRKGFVTFFVPINFPEIHRLTLSELLMLAEHPAQSPTINSP